METTTPLVLNGRLNRSMGDWIEEVVTTNIAADSLKACLFKPFTQVLSMFLKMHRPPILSGEGRKIQLREQNRRL